jgi:hypothetical protein
VSTPVPTLSSLIIGPCGDLSIHTELESIDGMRHYEVELGDTLLNYLQGVIGIQKRAEPQ